MDKKWFGLAGLALALIMIFIDQTALPVALPTIQHQMALTNNTAQWIIASYLLCIAAFIILSGKLGDILGHGKIFRFGMIIFAMTSLFAAVASSIGLLLTARFLQGVGAALMMPSSGVLLITLFSPQERGRAMGIYFTATTLFLAIGPIAGGLITDYVGWRYIFLINLPLALASLLLLRVALSAEVKENKLTTLAKIDWLGFFTLSLSITSLIFFFMQTGNGPLLTLTNMISLAIFVISLMIFVKFSVGKSNALINVDFFKNKVLKRCIYVITLMQVALAAIIFWPLYLQRELFFTPTQTSILMLAAYLPLIFVGPIAGKSYDRYGPNFPSSLGMLCLTLGFLWTAVVTVYNFSFWLLIPGFLAVGVGIPFIITSIMVSFVTYADPASRGLIYGIANVARQIGGAVGLALVSTVVYSFKNFANGFSMGMFLVVLLMLVGITVARQLPAKTDSTMATRAGAPNAN